MHAPTALIAIRVRSNDSAAEDDDDDDEEEGGAHIAWILSSSASGLRSGALLAIAWFYVRHCPFTVLSPSFTAFHRISAWRHRLAARCSGPNRRTTTSHMTGQSRHGRRLM